MTTPDSTPELIAYAVFPAKMLDRAGNPIRGTTLKLTALAVWASRGDLVHLQDLSARTGCSKSQTWRALDVLADAGIIERERIHRAGKTRYSPRCRCRINVPAMLAMVAGSWSPERNGPWRDPSTPPQGPTP